MIKKERVLTGNIANRGFAKGKAVVIRSLDDLKNVEEGNILVSEKTIPAMVVAMHKCVGVITDRGGITSHAAIVSRELGIPCLVGCNNATTVLGNGDLVVLDAFNGVARAVTQEEFSSIKESEKSKQLKRVLEQKPITDDSLDDIDRYLNSVEYALKDFNQSEIWPLNAVQVEAYFDVDEALEMNYLLNKLKSKKPEEVAHLFPRPIVMKYALQHNLIIGLKVANKLGFAKVPVEEMTANFLFFTSVLKQKQRNDPFDYNAVHIYSREEVSRLKKDSFIAACKENIGDLMRLITLSDALISSLYYDLFVSAGLERHGPYDVSKEFGPGAMIIVFDYYDLRPIEIWGHIKKSRYKSLKIYLVYKDADVRIDFVGRILSESNFLDRVLYFKLESDPKSEIKDMINDFSELVVEQTKHVEGLSDLDKVRKGALIYHYQFKELRKSVLGFWKPRYVETVISKFGDSLIRKYTNWRPTMPYKKTFDPRIYEFG